MKTFFFCKEINYKNIRYDTKIYSLNQRYVVIMNEKKFLTRISSIKFNKDGTREIHLELEKHEEKTHQQRLPLEISVPSPSWIDNMIKEIEGKKGRVYWNRRRKKRRY